MYLTRDMISAQGFMTKREGFSAGASVIFLGMIRSHSENRKVKYLEYEAYESMAEKMLEGLIRKAHNRWPLEAVKLSHRLGRVEPGEIAVAIDVRAAHRDEAYQASRFLIEEIKHQVPIWKKEYFEDGTSEWGLCQNGVLSGHAEL